MGRRIKRLVEVMEKPSLFGVLRQQQEEWRPSKEAIREAHSLIFTEKDYAETRCGLGSFSPSWLQVLARKEAYLAVFCLVGLVQGMFFTYTVSVISTLEKRFKLTSKQTGAILCGNDISQVILAIFLGYYGNFGHRPRLVGVGVLCAAASCFLAALPHLLYGPGQDALDLVAALNSHRDDPLGNASLGVKKMEVCYSRPDEACSGADGGSGGDVFGDVVGEDGGGGGETAYVGPIILFFISQFFVGVSVSNFYSIGITYLDDNVNKKTYPLFYSMTLLLRILGPVLGYLVGGRCLSTWVDPSQDPNLSRRDPRWLGAWWLGFVFLGCGLTFVGALLFLFPRRLPGTLRREAKRVARLAEKEKALEAAGEMPGVGSRGLEYFASMAKVKKEQADKPTLTNLRAALGRLFTNKLWLGNLFNTVVVVFAFSGYWNFKPKYLENQFRKSAAEATYYTGVVSLASILMGTALGGIIMRWIRPRPRYVAAYNVFITIVLSAGFAVLMFIGCPRLDVVGPVQGSPVPPCSSDCGCSERFSPMCAADNVTLFYSPCYAACTAVNTFANPVVFSDCGCFDNSTTATTTTSVNTSPWLSTSSSSYHTTTWPSSLMANPGEGGGGGFGVSGYCPDQCETSFYYYLITQVVLKTITSTGRVGSSVLHIRSVSDEDKGLALGTLTVFISLFAFIPAPIIMGAIIDSSCLVWDKTCGRSGNCWLYDSDKFRTIIHLLPAAVILLSLLGDLVVLWYSHQLDLYGEKEDDLELQTTPPTTPTTPLTPLTPTSTITTDSNDSSPPPPSPSESQEHQQHQKPFYLLPPHPHHSSHSKKQEEKEKEEREEVEEESKLLSHPV